MVKKWQKILGVVLVLAVAAGVLAGFGLNVEGAINSFSSSFKHSDTQKKLVFGRANDSITLDPANTTELETFKVTVNIFETLVKYEDEGNKIIPCLAESWKSSEDGLTWVFHLRQGVKFHDGTAFDAQAVEFNFKRWMDAGSPYHIGKFNYWNYVFGGFPGFVKSVTALSDYSLEIVLMKPYAPFLSVLANPAFGIASPEAIKRYNEEMDFHPVGTGPFCFKSWDKGKSIIITRNAKYWGTMAKLNEVEFKVIPSSKDRLVELRKGTVQIVDSLAPEDVADAKRDTAIHMYLRPCFNVGYLAMNTQKAPFDNRNIRTAISQAIDKDKLIREVFDNLAKPANTLVPPVLWGHNENIKRNKINIEKAKEILKQEGYPNGFKTTLWVMDSPRAYFSSPIRVAQYIRDSLKLINVDAQIKIFSWDEYLERIQNGEHDMALMGWTGDNLDPDNFLYTFLSSENAKPGIAGNYAFYKNADVDRMLEQARQNTNVEFRKSLYRKLQETVDYDTPNIPLVHTMPAVMCLWSVKGYIPHITGVESLEEVYVEND